MEIFVTGASGFVGGAATRRLLQAGHTVLAMSRSPGSDAVDAENTVYDPFSAFGLPADDAGDTPPTYRDRIIAPDKLAPLPPDEGDESGAERRLVRGCSPATGFAGGHSESSRSWSPAKAARASSKA